MSFNNIVNSITNFFSDSDQVVLLSNRDLPGAFKNRGPRDSILVIDASGSMYDTDWQPSRLEAARQAALTFARRLRSEEAEARVAVVAYGYDATLLCGLTLVTNYKSLEESISSIDDGSGTNLTAGLEIAWTLIEHSNRLCQVVLLTDGWHNVGEGPKSISDKLKEKAIIECVGIGGSPSDVDEELLRYIASPYPDGSKRYRWIGEKERLIEHFHDLAGRLVRA